MRIERSSGLRSSGAQDSGLGTPGTAARSSRQKPNMCVYISGQPSGLGERAGWREISWKVDAPRCTDDVVDDDDYDDDDPCWAPGNFVSRENPVQAKGSLLPAKLK